MRLHLKPWFKKSTLQFQTIILLVVITTMVIITVKDTFEPSINRLCYSVELATEN